MNNYPLNHAIGYLIGRSARVMSILLNHNFKQAGLDAQLEHWIILSILKCDERYSQQKISEVTGRDKTAITRFIDELESRGLVKREFDPQDRRNKIINITKKGEAFYQKMIPVVEKTNKQAEEGIEEEELNICKNVLDRIYHNAHLKD